jgi:ANTH domain
MFQELGLTDSSRQPILADEVQTFKALITIHKVLQEGHPVVLKEAQGNVGWLESLRRGVGGGEGIRGQGPTSRTSFPHDLLTVGRQATGN